MNELTNITAFARRTPYALTVFQKVAVYSSLLLLAFFFMQEFAIELSLAQYVTDPQKARKERIRNQRSFVVITVKSPAQPPDEPDMGSGIVVSEDGHILTAAHLIKQAMDKTTDGEDERRIGSRISVQFVNDRNEVELGQYEADVVRYLPEPGPDLALLSVNISPSFFRQRGLPTLDPDAGLKDVNMFILGHTEYKYEWVPAAPGKTLSSYKRMLTSNMAGGYNGGPVFHQGEQWTLAGIGISGHSVRLPLNFMVTLHAAEPLLDMIRERVRFIRRELFPSPRFSAWANVNVRSVNEIKEFVERGVQQNTVDFVTRLLREDFAVSDKELQNNGKFMLEHALLVMSQQNPIKPPLFTLLVEKLVGIYSLLGVGKRQKYDRWLEDVLVQERHCQSLSKQTKDLIACWDRVVRKHEQFWKARELRSGYQDAWNSYSEEGRERIGDVILWSKLEFRQRKEWADALARTGRSKFGGKELSAGLGEKLQLLFLDKLPVPHKELAKSIKPYYLAAAADKYLAALEILESLGEDSDLRGSFQNFSGIRKEICEESIKTLQLLRSLLDRGDYLEQVIKILDTQEAVCHLWTVSNGAPQR